MGSLTNFYHQVLQVFLERYRKSRQKMQITNRSQNIGEFITESYKSSSPSLTPKHYCRELGFQGNVKRNSFVPYTALHKEMQSLPCALVQLVLLHSFSSCLSEQLTRSWESASHSLTNLLSALSLQKRAVILFLAL